MTFDQALKSAQVRGRFIRREAWSMGRPSIVLDGGAWFDAFGRPYSFDHSDEAAAREAQDWIVLGDPT